VLQTISAEELALSGGANGATIAEGVGLAGLAILGVAALPEAAIGLAVYGAAVLVGGAAGAIIAVGSNQN
jgi:hypothetical protein